MHEHFDAENNLIGTTVVTRESPWDDASRGRALRLDEYEASFCTCGCGQPLAIARDPDQIFMVDELTCYARRALDEVQEKRQAASQVPGRVTDSHGKFPIVRPHDPRRDPAPPKPKTETDGANDVSEVRPGPTQG